MSISVRKNAAVEPLQSLRHWADSTDGTLEHACPSAEVPSALLTDACLLTLTSVGVGANAPDGTAVRDPVRNAESGASSVLSAPIWVGTSCDTGKTLQRLKEADAAWRGGPTM